MFEFLVAVQRAIRDTLSGHIESFAANGDWSTLFAMLPLGIAFGIAHAMTPGHSKSVLASFVLGIGASVGRAAATSLLLSATHIVSAIVLALVANSLVTRTLVGAGRAPALEYTSRMALVVIPNPRDYFLARCCGHQ
jgi:ABC-type nickel/cobalt efflux system permease component RcnA